MSRRFVLARWVALAALVALTTAACTEAPPPEFGIQARGVALHVTDERRASVAGAEVEVGGEVLRADRGGRIEVPVSEPTATVISAPGYLAEPFVLTRDMTPDVAVQLLAREGPSGEQRVALHFGGDVMLGRRYLEPARDGTPRVDPADDGTSARAVVSSVGSMMAAADISSVNLESVIGSWDAGRAYPGKRFLLQSPPNAVAALDELGIDVATLGNNHSYDWRARGVRSTLDALGASDLAAHGAGGTDAEARRPANLSAGGSTVGFLSYTTVTGDFVNDSLHRSGQAVPSDLRDQDAWQYERRPFKFTAANGRVIVPRRRYTPGDVWDAYREVEDGLDAETNAALWEAMTAANAFPQLQDWVARRGHGGAAWFRSGAVEEDIAALKEDGADIVVVQIHGGFQFAEVVSSFFGSAARASIDGGADLVVGHHPHVLQGFEWYRGKLIAHSLGNLVFDQDFLSTFPSAVLRAVYEGSELIAARVYPVVLDDYRPEPLAGAGAERILRTVDERSAGNGVSDRLEDQSIGMIAGQDLGGVVPAQLKSDPGRGARVVKRTDRTVDIAVDTGDDGMAELRPRGLIRAGSDLDGVHFGRDLFGWGSFEDVEADGQAAGGIHWAIAGSDAARVRSVEEAPSGHRFVEVTNRPDSGSDVLVRPVARITPSEHRLYTDAGTPADGEATYSMTVAVRAGEGAAPFIRLDGYRFSDADPTRDPQSELIRRTEVPIAVARDGEWHRVTVELPPAALAPSPDGDPINAAMFYLGLPPPDRGTAVVGFDDVAFLEWRAASELPPGTWSAVDAVRVDDQRSTVTLTGSGAAAVSAR